MTGVLLLVGGPAGSGKSTLARAWCDSRPLAVHVELDEIRHLIVSGRADPQRVDDEQAEQYASSVAATCALARAFLTRGYDVAVDDVLDPPSYERAWRPEIGDLGPRVVVVLPSLEETLARAGARSKRVMEHHIRAQHAASGGWDAARRIDTTGRSVAESVELLHAVVARPVA